MVTVRLFAAARAAAGCPETTVEASSLQALVGTLGDTFGSDLTLVLRRCSFLIDGVAVHDRTADVNLPPGATVDVLPPFAGG